MPAREDAGRGEDAMISRRSMLGAAAALAVAPPGRAGRAGLAHGDDGGTRPSSCGPG